MWFIASIRTIDWRSPAACWGLQISSLFPLRWLLGRWLFGLGLGLLGLGLSTLQAYAQSENLPDPFEFLSTAASPAPASTEAASTEAASTDAASTEPVATQASGPEQAGEPAAPAADDRLAPALDSTAASVEAQPPDQPLDPPPVAPLDAVPPALAAAAEVDGDRVLEKRFQRALLIDASGPIFDRFHWYLNNRLDLAQREQVDLIVIRLTSPGGDLEHSLQLARRLRDIDWATTVAYVSEEAISGGAIIALGCDRIYMQSGALIGDAGPIRMGLGGQFEHAEEKIVSYTVSAVRELAAGKDRPPALAEAMVDRTVVVYEATELASGKQVFLSEKEFDKAGVAERYQLGPAVPEAGQNRFLTVGADRALELHLCEGVFASETELLERMSIDRLEPTRMTWVDKTVFTLNRPWLTALLLIAGMIGMYLELAAPGISVAGLTALLCFGIFFWSHALGGTAGWLEVLLFFAGISCLAFELFVLPGFGVFGISGLGLVILSLVMASQDFVVPTDAAQWDELRKNLLIVVGAVSGVLILLVGQIILLDTIPGLNRFRLSAPEVANERGELHTSSLLQPQSAFGFTPTPGAQGIAASDLRPSGKIKIDDALFDVLTEGDYIEAGLAVEVIKVEGNRIVVRKVAS